VDGKVDKRGCASSYASFSAVVEVVGSSGAHERQLHVSVCVDSSRNKKFAAAVDDFGSLVGEIGLDGCNFSAL